MTGAGLGFSEVIVYEMAEVGGSTGALSIETRAALAEGAVAAVEFWSPRAAKLFAKALDRAPAARAGLGRAGAAAISAAAAAPLVGCGFERVEIAPTPDADGMDRALAALRPAR